jgi:hypothetical protein
VCAFVFERERESERDTEIGVKRFKGDLRLAMVGGEPSFAFNAL